MYCIYWAISEIINIVSDFWVVELKSMEYDFMHIQE